MKHILNNIIKYLNSKDRTGAFQVKGEWGSGKTYFFKEVLPEKIKSETNRLQVMISLFGLGNIKEIPFRLLNAYINKKREQGLSANEDMNRGLDYLDLKYGVDRKLFGVDLHDEDEMIYCIIPKDKVYLCFDDVERFVTKENVEEILGTINNLTENLGFKVIVISNDHYHDKDSAAGYIKSKFKEKIIGSAVIFMPNVAEIYENVVDGYNDLTFSKFMKREDVERMFLPYRRDITSRKDFVNIRNIKFAVSNFYEVFDHYRNTTDEDKTITSLKYYLAFIIGVSIEYKKDILTDVDNHTIKYDTEVYSLNLGDDDEMNAKDVQEMFSEYEETSDEQEKRKKKEQYNAVYRRRFYTLYARKVNQRNVYHEELYNYITMGCPIDYEKLEANIEEKVFSLEKENSPGNTIVSQTLDGTIFNYTDDEIKAKMLTLLKSVEEGGLKVCAAYVNAFSFLDMYKTVVGKSHDELLTIFKKSITDYIANQDIDQMERTGLEMVAQDVPNGTRDFYNFMRDELHNKWKAGQSQGLEEMVELFNTDIPRFCGLFSERQGKVTVRYISEAVLHHIPEETVELRMHNLNPRGVHELAKLLIQRYSPQDIYAYHLLQEKGFLEAMKRGIKSIEGDDSVSKVEAKNVLLHQVEKALEYIRIAGETGGQVPVSDKMEYVISS